MLRRDDVLQRRHPADRAAGVRDLAVRGDLGAGELVPSFPDPEGEGRGGDRERGLHQEADQRVPHVRGPREHRGAPPPLRDLQEHLPAEQERALRAHVRRGHHLRRRRLPRVRPQPLTAQEAQTVPEIDRQLSPGKEFKISKIIYVHKPGKRKRYKIQILRNREIRHDLNSFFFSFLR